MDKHIAAQIRANSNDPRWRTQPAAFAGLLGTTGQFISLWYAADAYLEGVQGSRELLQQEVDKLKKLNSPLRTSLAITPAPHHGGNG